MSTATRTVTQCDGPGCSEQHEGLPLQIPPGWWCLEEGQGQRERRDFHGLPCLAGWLAAKLADSTGNAPTVDEPSRAELELLRWLGDPSFPVQVDSTNSYQVSEFKGAAVGLGTDGGTGPVRRWRAERVGGQDEDNVALGEWNTPEEAKAACQADAEGRAS